MPALTVIRSPPAPAPSRELDAATLTRAQRGDEAACRALVELYQGRVFAVVGRTLGRDRAARVEDVCQECFLKVFRALPRFDLEGSARLSTWIFTIALRLCFDELRRTRRPHVELPEDLRAPSVTEEVALERALQARVERALATLTPELRATFALRVTAELSVEETARALGVDEGTVKSRLSRARQQLRDQLGEV